MPRQPIYISPRNPSDWYKRNVKKWEESARARGCPTCNAPRNTWCRNLNDLDELILTMHRERLSA